MNYNHIMTEITFKATLDNKLEESSFYLLGVKSIPANTCQVLNVHEQVLDNKVIYVTEIKTFNLNVKSVVGLNINLLAETRPRTFTIVATGVITDLS